MSFIYTFKMEQLKEFHGFTCIHFKFESGSACRIQAWPSVIYRPISIFIHDFCNCAFE